MMLIVDIAYTLIDPRIRLTKEDIKWAIQFIKDMFKKVGMMNTKLIR